MQKGYIKRKQNTIQYGRIQNILYIYIIDDEININITWYKTKNIIFIKYIYIYRKHELMFYEMLQ